MENITRESDQVLHARIHQVEQQASYFQDQIQSVVSVLSELKGVAATLQTNVNNQKEFMRNIESRMDEMRSRKPNLAAIGGGIVAFISVLVVVLGLLVTPQNEKDIIHSEAIIRLSDELSERAPSIAKSQLQGELNSRMIEEIQKSIDTMKLTRWSRQDDDTRMKDYNDSIIRALDDLKEWQRDQDKKIQDLQNYNRDHRP